MSGNLGMRFDATTVTPNTGYEPLPAGNYTMQIIDSSVKEAKSGNGSYLELEMEVLDGDYAGRKYWDRLNLWNVSAQTVEIAQRTLSALCHATGQLAVDDSSQLHFKPFTTVMRLSRRKDNGELENRANYKALDGAAPAAPASPAGGTSPAPATAAPAASPKPSTASAAPPWRQKKSAA